VNAIVLQAHAADLPLPDESVDLIVTSPPYWKVRDYRDGGESLKGQIGSEETPAEYIAALLRCTREWMRVLKPSGSLFVNIGDKYATRYSSTRRAGRAGLNGDDDTRIRLGQNRTGVGEKSLLGLPWRYAIGCTDDLGLILRAEIIWAKPGPMPESAGDRAHRAHEQVFHLVKQPRYFTGMDEIREPVQADQHTLSRRDRTDRRLAAANGGQTSAVSPLGKAPGSVWEMTFQPLAVPEHVAHARCCQGVARPGCEGLAHHAAFPMDLPRRCILGWSPSGICLECGEGRRPVTSSTRTLDGQPCDDIPAWADPSAPRRMPNGHGHSRFGTDRRPLGYACACLGTSAPASPAVVADPFGGTGTVALVASAYGRTGVTADLSADYCRIAQWRTADPGERARVLGLPKPPPEPIGMDSLFGPEDWLPAAAGAR
jgi:DNA modification methylase